MMRLINVLILSGVCLLCSCLDESEPIDVPVNTPTGEYDHESSSQYINEKGDYIRSAENQGTVQIRYSYDSTTAVMTVTPLYGWVYDLSISSIEKIIVDEKEAYSFRIPLQQVQFINYDSFNVKGNYNQELKDKLGNTVKIEDGVISSDGILSFEFTSVNIVDGSKVVTFISGRKRY